MAIAQFEVPGLQGGDQAFVEERIGQFQAATELAVGEANVEGNIFQREFIRYPDLDYVNPHSYFGRGQEPSLAVALTRDEHRLVKAGLAMVEDARIKKAQDIFQPVIVDAGTGTGVLAYLAQEIYRREELAPEVVAIEIEKNTLELVDLISKHINLEADFVLADATEPVDQMEGRLADTVLSENIYCGLLAEPQIAIVGNMLVNHAIVEDDTVRTAFIPRGVDLSVFLGHTGAALAPFETVSTRSARFDQKTPATLYKSLDFEDTLRELDDNVLKGVEDTVYVDSGLNSFAVNAVGLRTAVRFGHAPETTLYPNTARTLGNDQLIPIPPGEFEVKQDGLTPVHITYPYGGNVDDIKFANY